MLKVICAEAPERLTFELFKAIQKSLFLIRKGDIPPKRVILTVPAQFTLRAEELAFEHLGGPGFFDFHVMSGKRLREQILRETSGMGKTPIDPIGRAMLIRKILKDESANLGVFSPVAGDPGFLKMAGDLILRMKQNGVTSEDLSRALETFPAEGLISEKIKDVQRIFSSYEKAMEGKITDTEDLRAFVSGKVKECEFIKESEIFYYDFYSFTKRDLDFLTELMIYAGGLNVALLCDGACEDAAGLSQFVKGGREVFKAPRKTFAEIAKRAKSVGTPFSACFFEGPAKDPIGGEKLLKGPEKRPAELTALAAGLFEPEKKEYEKKPSDKVLRVVRCANPFSEAEAAASEILRLIREEGHKCSDIAVLTGDMAGQGAAVRRVLRLYGVPVFTDEKRSVRHSPAISALCALLDIAAEGYEAEAVCRFLKSGLSGIATEEEIEEFENYITRYHIDGPRFLKPFVYGKKYMGGSFTICEEIRAKLLNLLLPFTESFGGAIGVRKRCGLLYDFLNEKLRLSEALEEKAVELSEAGLFDSAEESSQIWEVITGLMDQASELLSEEETDASDFRDLFSDGLSDIKVGLLPQEEESVAIGPIGRTRITGVKDLFIVGLNDGVIPFDKEAGGIFTESELSDLEKRGLILMKTGDRLLEEEKFTLYRSFSEPKNFLWLGYSVKGPSGSELKPSPLVSDIKEAFPLLEEESDFTVPRENSPEKAGLLMQTPASSAVHLAEYFRHYLSGELSGFPGPAKESWNVLLSSGDPKIKGIKKGIFYDNTPENLEPLSASMLYGKQGQGLLFSPSRLESFAACPFKHFIGYGLSPDEQRPFEAGRIEQGEIYHEYLRRLSEDLCRKARLGGFDISDPRSDWMTVTDEELEEKTEKILSDIAASYSEGLLGRGAPEKYRGERIKKVALRFARELIEQVRRGKISEMRLETPFGPGKVFPELEVKTSLGKVKIIGKIDRVDVIKANGARYVKIIDYKSGSEKFSKENAEKGLALQLSIYLESALKSGVGSEPAGIFYSGISEVRAESSVSDIGAEKASEEILKKILSSYRMNGLLIDDPEILKGIDSKLSPGERSPVAAISKGKDGNYKSSSMLISKEDFLSFRNTVKEALKFLCLRLLAGDVSIDPRPAPMGRDASACSICDYKSICIYER